jgi:hypothetical protein
MSLAEGQVRLAFSIVGHEDLDTPLAQARNLRWFCEDPLVVVQLDSAVFAGIEEDAAQRRALRRLEREPGVLLNPRHLAPGAARGLQAHLSNFGLLAGRGEAFSHFVTLSAGELFFRHGVEAHLRGLDAVAPGGPPLPVAALPDAPAPWGRLLRADAGFLALLAARGLAQLLQAPPEGSFHSRALMAELARLLERHFASWAHDGAGHAARFYLPTLMQEHPAARCGPGLVHVIGARADPKRARRALAMALCELGALDPKGGEGLGRWGRAVLRAVPAEAEDPLRGRFALGGLPRAADHPLRLLIEQASAPAGPRRARALASRLGPKDLRRRAPPVETRPAPGSRPARPAE